jgi:hypothetical protein
MAEGGTTRRLEDGQYIPIYKKGDKIICQNYRGIALLMMTYKLLSRILVCRTTPYMEAVGLVIIPMWC